MPNHFRIPLITPFKFVPSTKTAGIHFDDDWACHQIKLWERDVCYRQKWVRTETTKIQIDSSIAPTDIQVWNKDKQVVRTITWTTVFAGISYSIYEAVIDFSGLPSDIYFLYFKVALLGLNWPVLSEPIQTADSWPGTLLFTYYNRYNDFDVAWSTGIQMKFRCEAGIMDFQPERDRAAYMNQLADVVTESNISWRSFKLYIADATGVPPYIVDILNRIFGCSYIDIQGKQYQSTEGSKWEINRIHGYPWIGANIEIAERFSNNSLEFADATPLPRGIVTAYNIHTSFFGPGTLVPVTDIENQ